jgi:hypothetical protein
MAIKRIIVHAFEIEDKPGGLQKLLAKAAADGVDLNCLTACGACGGGKAMAYLSAKNPEALKACAIKVGVKATEMAGFMLGGDDHAGAAGEALKPLADAHINGVAAAAMVCDGGYGMVVTVKLADADRAAKALGA